jgi:cytochrome b561
LHWITVVLVITLWSIGQTVGWLPTKSLSHLAWSFHVLLGVGLACVLMTRLVWRMHFGVALPPADKGVLQALAKITQVMLYLLLIAAVATGIATASYQGIDLFGVWHVPQFVSSDRAIKRSITEWHGLIVNTLLLLALLHASAALIHQYVWHDRLLNRMIFTRSSFLPDNLVAQRPLRRISFARE